MQLHISPKDGVPLYQQIMRQVKYLAASGRLEPGEQLKILAERLDQLLSEARQMKVGLDELIELARERDALLQKK